MGFPRQEYWSGLPFLSPGDLPEKKRWLVVIGCLLSSMHYEKHFICFMSFNLPNNFMKFLLCSFSFYRWGNWSLEVKKFAQGHGRKMVELSMWTQAMWLYSPCSLFFFLRVCWICYKIDSVFMIWCFGWEECEILAPQSGIKPSTPALEGKVSTNGPQVKSLACDLVPSVGLRQRTWKA